MWVLGNLSSDIFFVSDCSIVEDDIFRGINSFSDSVPTTCPVVYSSDIPTDTVPEDVLVKGISSENPRAVTICVQVHVFF